MRVYLAGAMRGFPEENRELFADWQSLLEAMGHEVFNPHEHCPPGTPIKECMLKDVTWICTEADEIAFIPGWEKSLGCRVEHALAVAIDLPIQYLV